MRNGTPAHRLDESVVVIVNVPHNIVPVEVKVAAGGSGDPFVSFWVGKDVHDHPCIAVLIRRANITIDVRTGAMKVSRNQ